MKIESILRSLLDAIISLVSVKERGAMNRSRAGIATWALASIIVAVLAIVFLIALQVLVFTPSSPT